MTEFEIPRRCLECGEEWLQLTTTWGFGNGKTEIKCTECSWSTTLPESEQNEPRLTETPYPCPGCGEGLYAFASSDGDISSHCASCEFEADKPPYEVH